MIAKWKHRPGRPEAELRYQLTEERQRRIDAETEAARLHDELEEEREKCRALSCGFRALLDHGTEGLCQECGCPLDEVSNSPDAWWCPECECHRGPNGEVL